MGSKYDVLGSIKQYWESGAVAQWWRIRLQCDKCGFGNIPCSRKWHPTPVFLPGKSHEQRSLVGYSPWGCRVGHDWAHTHTFHGVVVTTCLRGTRGRICVWFCYMGEANLLFISIIQPYKKISCYVGRCSKCWFQIKACCTISTFSPFTWMQNPINDEWKCKQTSKSSRWNDCFTTFICTEVKKRVKVGCQWRNVHVLQKMLLL